MKERFGARNPRSLMVRFHTQTAGCTLTAQQPKNNIIRVAYQALAAVLGGTQSLHTNSMDEALALPTEEAVQIALRTQQLIAHETGVADTADPMGGSFYVEHLTGEIEERAQEYIRKIDEMGGSPRAIEKGFIQKEIQEAAYTYQKEIESHDRIIVGINRFQTEGPPLTGLHRGDPAVRERQAAGLEAIRARRDRGRVQGALRQLQEASEGSDNLMPPIIEAVKAEATLGEICDVLRGVFGEYQASVIF
jgi:methylmalonyl-CoA mutase N-terminal domain/subunit